MNEYFDLPVFNPAGKTGTLDCHHIHPYEPEKGTVNNHSDNLQMVDPNIHMSVFNPVQNGVLTQEGMKLKNPKQFWKRLSEIDTDKAFAIVSDIDRESGNVVGVHGEELSEEQVRRILQEPKVQDFLCNAQRTIAEDYRRRIEELMEEVSKHPEKYRIVDGIPVLKINNQKKGEKGNGRD